jgi:cellulose synthase operon protein C
MANQVCTHFLILGILFLVSCASPQQKYAHHLEQAEHWATAGKTDEAILEYRRAIQVNPRAAAPHTALAKIYIGRNDYPNAYREVSTVQKNDPNNHDAKLMISDLMLRTRNFSEAEKQAQILVNQNPNDVAALMIVGESAFALKDKQLARSSIEHILQLDARNSRAWYLRGMLQLLDRQNVESEESFAKAIEYGPDSIPPVTASAASMLQRGDATGAEKAIRQAVERNPKNIEAHKLLAAFLLAEKRPKETEDVFRKISQIGDDDPETRGVLARYYSYVGNREGAMREYQSILKKHPEDVPNGLLLVSVYAELGKTSESEQLLSEISKRKPNDPKVLVAQGRWHLAQGRIDDGIRDLLHASQLDAKWALPQYFLGLAYIRQGKLELAQASLNNAAQLDPELPGPRLMLAQLALDAGKPQRAIDTLEQTLKSEPHFVEPYLMRALALAQQGQYAKMEKATLPLVDEFPQPTARAMTYRTLAWAKFHQQRYDEAHTYAMKSLEYEPASTEGLYILGSSDFALKKIDAGVAEVQGFVQSNAGWAPGYATLGRLQAMAGRFPDAEKSLRKSLELEPNLLSAELGLAGVELTQGKLDSAMDELRKLTQSHPDFVAAHVQMGQISEMKQDWKSAEGYYSKALTISPQNVVAKNNLAWLYAEHGGNIDVALKLAQDAKESSPDNADVSDTLGWIMLKKQNYTTAVQLLSECVHKEPEKGSFRYHLGLAYFYMGEKSEAESTLQAVLRLEPTSPDAAEARKILSKLNN